MFKKKIIRVGLLQMHCVSNPAVNLATAIQRIKKLSYRGAQIICLPELFWTEYFCQTENKKFFDFAQSVPGPLTRELAEAAKKYNVVLVTSIYEKDHRGKFFNTAVIINEKGRLAGKYRKMHIPDDLKNYYGEAFYFEKGNLGIPIFKTKYANIGVQVCWDQWFPEGARSLALKGAEIIFYPTAIGFQLKDTHGINSAEHEAWQTIQRSHAIANNVFVVAVNRVGKEHKLRFWGTSFVSDPYGRVIAKAPTDREADLIVDCDLSLIAKMRRDWPFLKERRINFL